MRKKIYLFCFIAAAALLSSCSKVDLAKDISARIEPTKEVTEVLEKIRTASSDDDRMKIISDNQWLTNRLVSYARQLKQIPDSAKIDSVVYYFGSASAQAEDKTGKLFKGKIIEEAVGFIYYNSLKEPKGIIVYCQNGTFGALKDLRRIGSASLEFWISKGDALLKHVDYETSMSLAERFGLEVYAGSGSSKHRISIAGARRLEDETDRILVEVRVYPGDYFNLATPEYIPALISMSQHVSRVASE